MSIVVALLAVVAFLLLGLGSEAHFRRRLGWGAGHPWRRRLKLGGWSLLAIAFPVAIVNAGWIFGPILWAGIMMAGAGVAFLVLNLAPIPARPVASVRRGRDPAG